MPAESQFPAPLDRAEPVEVVTRPLGPSVAVGAEGEHHQERPAVSLRQVLRYKWSILAVFVLVVGAALPSIWLTLKPSYRAEALIEVKAAKEILVYSTNDNRPIGSYWMFLNTQVGILTSPEILKRVVAREDVQQTEWYRTVPQTLSTRMRGPSRPYERLRDALEVEPDGSSQLIVIAAETLLAEEAALLANALAEEYLDFIRAHEAQDRENSMASLRAKEQQLRSNVAELEVEAARRRAELGTAQPDELVSQKRLRLDEQESDLTVLDTRIESQELKLAGMRETQQQDVAVTSLPEGSTYQFDPVWRDLDNAAKQARLKLHSARLRLGPQHPQITQLEEGLQQAESDRLARERVIDAHPVTAVPVPQTRRDDAQTPGEKAARMTMPELEDWVAFLKLDREVRQAQLKVDQEAFEKLFARAQQLNDLNKELAHYQGVYDDVRRELVRRETERDAPDQIELIAGAITPNRSHKDLRVKLSAAAIVGGLVLGLAVGFVRVRMSPSLEDVSEVTEMHPAMFLGRLPTVAGTPTKAEDAIAQLDHVRMLRTALLRRLAAREDGALIQITSAGPRSGKTSTALSLATSLRDCGKRVLLVDSDFRNPSLAPRLSCPNEPGFIELLRGEVEEAKAVQEVDGLSFMPAGQQNGLQAADLLVSQQLQDYLRRWRDKYELIIVDAPPLLSSADAAILAPQLDGTVMVLREHHCRRDAVMEAIHRLETAGGELLGMVFIGKNRLPGTYGYPGSYDRA